MVLYHDLERLLVALVGSSGDMRSDKFHLEVAPFMSLLKLAEPWIFGQLLKLRHTGQDTRQRVILCDVQVQVLQVPGNLDLL